VKSGTGVPAGRCFPQASASCWSSAGLGACPGLASILAVRQALNAARERPVAALDLAGFWVMISTTATAIATTGTTVPRMIFGVEIGLGGRGGGVGNQEGLEKLDVTCRLCQVGPSLTRAEFSIHLAAGRFGVENGRVRVISTAALVVALGALLVPTGLAGGILTFAVKTRQGPTTAQPHPPSGGVGDSYVSSLELLNRKVAQLGKPAHSPIGTMEFTYTIRKQCTSFEVTCVATADFDTVSMLPGGTVLASGRSIPISDTTITIPVTGGTGRYAGATGTVMISPSSRKISTYELRFP
jgi:hypothetical protein